MQIPMLSRLALLIFVCNVVLANWALAQDDLDALPSSSETVQIEVLVFRFPGKGAGSELKPGQAPASNVGQAILRANSAEQTSAVELYSEVAPSQRRLSGAMARIQASSDLKPLLFTAWRQNLSDARWVSLQVSGTGAETGSETGSEKISGRLLLTPGKPLGLKLELQLDGAQLNGVVNDSANAASRFRMRANRPAHFEETLYFDHPALGALVRVDLSRQPEIRAE